MSTVDPSLLKAAGAVLAEAVATIPYNSANQFLEHFGGEPVDVRTGLSCVRQTVWTADRLREMTGVAPDLVRDGRHVAAICRDGGQLLVLDPYLMPMAPLLLDDRDVVDGQVVCAVDAYPLRTDTSGQPQPARLRATWAPDADTLRLDYVRFSPRRGHRYFYRSFTIPLAQRAVFPVPAPALRDLLLHPEQNNLSVRALHPLDQALSEVILPLGQPSHGIARPSLVSKDNEGRVSRYGSRTFDRDLAAVAEATGISGDAIVDLLLRAANHHAAASPPGRTLPAYALEDE